MPRVAATATTGCRTSAPAEGGRGGAGEGSRSGPLHAAARATGTGLPLVISSVSGGRAFNGGVRRPSPLFVAVSLAALLVPTLTACTVARRPAVPAGALPLSSAPSLERTLREGQSLQIELSLNGQAARSQEFRWTTSDPGVATVTASGEVRAVGAGRATIRASLTARPATVSEFQVRVTPRPAPEPAPTLDPLSQRVLDLTNAARARGHTCGAQAYAPTTPLRANARLQAAAQAHAADMATRNYFNHVAPDGRAPAARISASGYEWRAIAENIAAGQATPEEVVAGWLASEGHCRNLMSSAYTELGIGLATSRAAKRYWVQDFGTQ